MIQHPKTVAVLGSGIMGSGIAAFFADRGARVQMYDLKQEIAAASLSKLLDKKAKPPMILNRRAGAAIEPLGLDQLDARLVEADLIVEAVPEIMKIKLATFENVDKARREGTIVASNTSGLSITGMQNGRSKDFRDHFLGVHFFNPVRYMPLVELIPTDETDADVLNGLKALLTAAGKTPVIGRDTPNFVANRVGVFSMMKALELTQKYDLTSEEVDAITGPPMGAPKTGTYRLADMVGIDTLAHVATNSYENCPDDEQRDVFKPGGVLSQLVEKGLFGDKTRKGFYKKSRDAKGDRVIETLDLKTLEYRAQERPRLAITKATKGVGNPKKRVKALVEHGGDEPDKYANFSRELIASVGAYALQRVGKIADNAQTIDTALRAGFNREIGPIETLDAIGLDKAAELMQAYGIAVPGALSEAIRSRDTLSSRPAPRPGTINLRTLRKEDKAEIIAQNASGRIYDLGDGAILCEPFSSMVPSMNPVDDMMIEILEKAYSACESGEYKALVIGNQQANFCAGANLFLILQYAMAGQMDPIREIARRLQMVNLNNHHASFPVVTAPHGLALGGGLEITMGGQRRAAYAELYAGLVEVGVGLIPAGGGCYFLLKNWIDRMAKRQPGPMPPVAKAFESIGFGTVSSSAFDAMDKSFLHKDDVVVFSKDEQIAAGKKLALSMLDGFTPIEKRPLPLPGIGGRLALEANIEDMRKAGKISDHSARIANVQARVLTGGDLAAPGRPVTPEELLELERDAFCELCAEPKTQERMAHMLQKKKPLIN
jgi:3-hydroxyacyl-CoA dehydrogenase